MSATNSQAKTVLHITLLALALSAAVPRAASSGIPPGQGKRLNSFVTELVNVEVNDARPRAEYEFTNNRTSQGGWVFISSTAGIGDGGKVLILIDSEEEENAVITHEPKSPKVLETMRFLTAGKHRLIVKTSGAAQLKHLIVRSIPEILYNRLRFDPHVTPYGPYDWTFLKRIEMLDNVTTIISGRDTGREIQELLPYIKEWKARGGKWIVETDIPRNLSGEETYRIWAENVGFQHPLLDGIIVDEFTMGMYADKKGMAPYMTAIRRLSREFKGKRLLPYSIPAWGGAKPVKPFTDMLQEVGYPWAPEIYITTMATREAAKDRIEVVNFEPCLRHWREILHIPMGKVILTLGLMSEPPESLCRHPHADFKVFMDMQMNFLANDERFAGLGGISYYNVRIASEETIRWLVKLYRHYCIEGKTEMLSSDPYVLPHIINGDFNKDTSGWKISQAEKDSIAVNNYERLGWAEGRYPPPGQVSVEGDRCLWMKRSAKGPNVASQTITKLQPGRLYSFRMFTGDPQNFTAMTKQAVSIKIKNVELIPEKCFQHVFANPWHRMPKYGDQQICLNYHVKVFRAVGSEAKLVISDWVEDNEPGAPTGRETIFNFVQVRPYLED